MTKKEICLKLLEQIKEDEREYCFDKNYMSDEEWGKLYKETRKEAYNEVIDFWKDLLEKDLDEFLFTLEKKFGEAHDHILHVHRYVTEGIAEKINHETGKYIKFNIKE